MAASRVASGGRLCRRYQLFFYVALALVGMQLYLAYTFYSLSQTETEKVDEWKRRIQQIEEDHKQHKLLHPQNVTYGKKVNVIDDDLDKLLLPVAKAIKGILDDKEQKGQNEVAPPLDIPAPPPEEKYEARCEILDADAKSAIERAHTNVCKQEIVDVYCTYVEGKLYPLSLPRYCPLKADNGGEYVGCFQDSHDARVLDGAHQDIKDNSPQNCINFCLMVGAKLAGMQYSKECWCGGDVELGQQLDNNRCDSKCPGDASATCGGFLAVSVYHTGYGEKPKNDAPLVREEDLRPNETPVRIVFVLTVNGRALRQVKRLFKALYHTRHYFFIHVDKRQEYLHRELGTMAESFPNVRVASERLSTIWGGASLLTMHLHCMRELLAIKEWKWDYFINLSESDFLVKSVADLTAYLTRNKGKNFLKSHGTNTPRFLRKQGLDKLFVECDTHMWRLGGRLLPRGVRMDGGSDWFGLHWSFVNHTVQSTNPLVTGLKKFWHYALLPSESFFHTLLVNSEMCDTIVNNNLHLTNWRRKQGCKCQYKHIVDWCGCSPNDFLPSDISKLISQEDRAIFFARKFEAIINQEIIHYMDTYLFGPYPDDTLGLTSYWQNDFHHLDVETPTDDVLMTAYTTLMERAASYVTSNGASSGCTVRADKLLEVTLYNDNDVFQGILVLFSGESNGDKFEMETLFKPVEIYEVRQAIGASGRLIHFDVGTSFDPKEELFRNFARIMGPFSDIALRHEWGEGPEVKVTVAYIDPINVIAASYEITIKDTDRILTHKPDFQRPLRPGLWRVKVLYYWELIAEAGFVILPMMQYKGVEITKEQAEWLHNGPEKNEYVNRNFKEMENTLGLKDTEKLRAKAKENAGLTGKKLLDWVDKLLKMTFKLTDSCISSKSEGRCQKLLPRCEETSWSSKSPDPKSQISKIDKKNGTLMRIPS